MALLGLYTTLVLLLLGLTIKCHALELMETPTLDNDSAERESSDELLPSWQSYSRDTVANYNPHKVDANFRQLWERVPLQAKQVIKR
ncbi:CG42246 [Drosophila busckii]|uniref:CG42246 n=1 Tax=Drosophila busckii TaxID=30019 RepID=A0A0M4ELY2_DROBS|nr:uncharacterized protein LOC108606163 [Drosophila busckii]ALC48596.1 CG42246 [Drosophila busckii]